MRIMPLLAAAAVLWTGAATAFNRDPLAGLSAAIAKGEYPKTTSVVVAQGDKILAEQYFGDGSAEKLNNTRSATKIFAAIAVGVAIRDHAIPSEKAEAFAYLADLKPFKNDTPDKEAIRIQDMMRCLRRSIAMTTRITAPAMKTECMSNRTGRVGPSIFRP